MRRIRPVLQVLRLITAAPLRFQFQAAAASEVQRCYLHKAAALERQAKGFPDLGLSRFDRRQAYRQNADKDDNPNVEAVGYPDSP